MASYAWPMIQQQKRFQTSFSTKENLFVHVWPTIIVSVNLLGEKTETRIFSGLISRFIRRGRASRRKRDIDSDAPSDWEEVGSDVENTDELGEWMCQQAAQHPFLPKQMVVRKYLPPGTVMSLYEEYKATQQMLGAQYVSCLGNNFCFSCYVLAMLCVLG